MAFLHGVNESTWTTFLHQVSQALSKTEGLLGATVVSPPSTTGNAFGIMPPHSAISGLTRASDLRAAHVNTLTIHLFRSSPSSPVFDKLYGVSPHYNGPTYEYSVGSLDAAVQKVIEIAQQTFVQQMFPMDHRHIGSDPTFADHHEEPWQQRGGFFSVENQRARDAERSRWADGGRW
jgi:hypothetical protein